MSVHKMKSFSRHSVSQRFIPFLLLCGLALSGHLAGTEKRQGNPRKQQHSMGLGMVKPDFYENSVLYFYNNPSTSKPIPEQVASDSLVFKRSETGVTISYAPPWFAPSHSKMGYGVLFMRAVSISSEFAEIVVNEFTGQTAYISRHACQLQFWPDFLLSCNSVEPLSRGDNLVRVKPLAHASLVATSYAFLKPIRVSGQWMYVELLSDDFKPRGLGWIKWRGNGNLTITYSLFS